MLTCSDNTTHGQHLTRKIADNVTIAWFDENTFVNPFSTPSKVDAESYLTIYWIHEHAYVYQPSLLSFNGPRSSKKHVCTALVYAEAEYGVFIVSVPKSFGCGPVTDYCFHFTRFPITVIRNSHSPSCNPVPTLKNKNIAVRYIHKGIRRMGLRMKLYFVQDGLPT
ncbi:hypothetical protein Tco_0155379 [Tanacetum coccineum]